ncbi:nuclear fusion protein Fus1p [Monosporozyma servazzii]
MITQTLPHGVLTTNIPIIKDIHFRKVSNAISHQNLNRTSTSDIVSLHTSSGIRLSNLSNEPKSVSGKIIGLSIGLPIGIFCFGLMLFLIYFYFIKNSILVSNPPISPSDSIKSSGNNWFRNWFNIEGINYNNSDLEKNTRENVLWPSDNAIESKIQYNIGAKQNKKRYSHVLTPKYAYTQTPKYATNDVNELLYTPHIKIHSMGHSTLDDFDKVKDNNETTYEKYRYNKGDDTKWEYNSPLSKWFLRSSVYLKDKNMTTTSLNDLASKLTPTVHLKHLKILNRVNKSYSNDGTSYESERSPILEKPPHYISDGISGNQSHESIVESLLLPLPQTSHNLNESKIQNRRSFIYDSIGPQILNDSEGSKPDVTVLSLPNQKKLNKSDDINASTYEKKLPLTPHSEMEKRQAIEDDRVSSGKIYQVAQPYSPHLTDEISITPGEYVRILVTHNDGWCLVEKCTMDGTSKSLLGSNHNITDKKYLNEERGIIPSECLIVKKGKF